MTTEEFCDRINLQQEMVQKILAYRADYGWEQVRPYADRLLRRDSWDQAVKDLERAIGEDLDGAKLLSCLMPCILQTYDAYVRSGIPGEIFDATMKFITRFVGEHYATYGTHCFTWGFWLPRQVSLQEFRIGELEYELVEQRGERTISIHIPSDAILNRPALHLSLSASQAFLATYFQDYACVPMKCDSWLLSPVLKELLPPYSRILQFQQGFELESADMDNDGFMRWVYGRTDTPKDSLPEGTSLQRRIKERLLAGGKIGTAVGVLKQNPFE